MTIAAMRLRHGTLLPCATVVAVALAGAAARQCPPRAGAGLSTREGNHDDGRGDDQDQDRDGQAFSRASGAPAMGHRPPARRRAPSLLAGRVTGAAPVVASMSRN
jgi:hypothetical protein